MKHGSIFSRLTASSLGLGISVLLFFSHVMPATAASTDIVSDNSTVRDSLARLAADGVVPADASSFFQDRVLTRGQAAKLLEKGLGLLTGQAPHFGLRDDAGAVRSVLVSLRPELEADGVNVDAVLKFVPANTASYDLALQPEIRIDTGGSKNPGSGVIGIYRGTVVGDLGSSSQYGLSISDQAQDVRRVFFNDIGTHDYSSVNQAYVQFNGWHGLNFLVGRTDDNWGAGSIGGALLSDNAPPMDQLRVSFPFSFGKNFGRHWNYAQLASTFDNGGVRTYFQARRLEINFNSKWSGQYEEALKSTSSSLLLRAPLPFYPAKLIDNSTTSGNSEFIADFGAQYQPTAQVRAYGQFLLNDIDNPFRVIGLEGGSNTPQRLAYLGGISYQSNGTSLTGEYAAADATTYLDTNPQLAWTEGAYDNLGFPGGPNFNQVDVLLSQAVSPKLTLSLNGRDRFRYNNSYPAPTVQEGAASARYQFDRRDSVSLTYHDYHQQAYPIAAGSPGYPGGDGFIPVSEANPGSTTFIHELDAAYTFVF